MESPVVINSISDLDADTVYLVLTDGKLRVTVPLSDSDLALSTKDLSIRILDPALNQFKYMREKGGL